MSKLLAIASADWHIHKFRNFDDNGSRLKFGLMAMEEICRAAELYNVPLLFAGDWYHTNKEVETETHTRAMQTFKLHQPKITIAISGNHDLSERNTLAHRSPSHLDAYKEKDKFFLDERVILASGLEVVGIPYMDNKKELVERIKAIDPGTPKGLPKILLLHSDMPGAKTPEGYKVGHHEIPSNLDEFFKPWTWVLCGHIHMPQRLSKKVLMLGSPIHQNAGDASIDMGYWEIYEDKVKFIPLKYFPKFIKVNDNTEMTPGNYYIEPEVPLVDDNIVTGEFHINQSRKKLAYKYCKVKGIKSKSKLRALIKVLNEVD